MEIVNLFKKLAESKVEKLDDKISPHQSIFLRIGDSQRTLVSRIEDWDQENIYIGGISPHEVESMESLPDQRIEVFVLRGDQYFKSEVKFKETVEQPVYLWVLSRPRSFRPHKDRRRFFRMEHVIKAYTQEYPNIFQDYDEGVTKNLGAGGLLLISRTKYEDGAKIAIKLPEVNNTEYMGRIVWKSEFLKADKWYYGIKLIDISSEEQDRLAKYVSDRLAREKGLGYHG